MSHPPAHAETSGEIYTRAFWLVFVANLFLCTANTLTFRFAEFVTFLGGSEELTGRVVAVGLIASMVWRAFLGQAIDRFGVRNVWLFSTLIYLVGAGLLAWTHSLGWPIYVARATFIIGISSMVAAALSFVQGLAPPARRTEIIGTYGASGFLGMIVGAQIGDHLFRTLPQGSLLFQVLFGLTLVLGAAHGLLALFMIGNEPHVRPAITPAVHQLAWRYWPTSSLLVTTMMGLAIAISTVFLTRFATERGIHGLRVFFSVYAITAFTMRLTARNWSHALGRHRLIVVAMAAQMMAFLLLIPVSSAWHFIPAGICFGFGQALLFPCIVSLCAGAFPEQYRGTGTTLALSAIDMGTMISAPLMGWFIDLFGFQAMLVGASLLLVIGSLVYASLTWNLMDADMHPAGHPVTPVTAPSPVAVLPMTTDPVPSSKPVPPAPIPIRPEMATAIVARVG